MEVHGDVMRMAQSDEQRERIKWFHARRLFFDSLQFDQGLALAAKCRHPDAVLLVSLFPAGSQLHSRDGRILCFLRRTDDARCMFWAQKCGAEPRELMIVDAAQRGDAWAQAKMGEHGNVKWLELSAAQGDPEGMSSLADWLYEGTAAAQDNPRALQLWRLSSELGHASAQMSRGSKCCAYNSLEQIVWYRRAVEQGFQSGILCLYFRAQCLLRLFDRGQSGRIVYELGRALEGQLSWFERFPGRDRRDADRCVALYRNCVSGARSAALCWMWLAKQLGICLDMRVLICMLIWEMRTTWSDRSKPALEEEQRHKKFKTTEGRPARRHSVSVVSPSHN